MQEIRWPQERALLDTILEGSDKDALAAYEEALQRWGSGSRNAVLMNAAAHPGLREAIAVQMAALPLERSTGGHRVNPPVKLAQTTSHLTALAIGRTHSAGAVREAAAKNPVTTDEERLGMLPDASGRVWSAVARSLDDYSVEHCEALLALYRPDLNERSTFGDTQSFPFWKPLVTRAPHPWAYRFLADHPNAAWLIPDFQKALIRNLRHEPEHPDWDMLTTMPITDGGVREALAESPAAPEHIKVLAFLSSR